MLSTLFSCNSINKNKLLYFEHGKAVVKGKITNPVDSFIIFSYQGDPATGHLAGERYVAQIQSDGSFEVSITLKKPAELSSDYGGKYLTVYLEPSYTTNIAFDGKNYKGVTYSGDGQEENQIDQIINTFKSQESTKLNDSESALNFEEIKLLHKKVSRQRLSLLEARKSAKQLSDHFYNWKKAEIIYEVPYMLYYSHRQHNVDYLTATALSSYDLNDDFAAAYSQTYNSVIDFYAVENFLKARKQGKYVGHNYDHGKELLEGLTKDAFLARMVMGLVKFKQDSLARHYHDEARVDISDTAILAQINDVFSQYQQITSKGYKVGKDALAIKAPSLSSILKNYKGKVVYIDFWATWCGPCVKQLDYSKVLHNQESAKDVVFLYLGYKDKEAAWQKMREEKNISGEHFLLNNAQIKEVELLLNVYGIPRYAILDKAGNIMDDNAPDPANSDLPKTFNNLKNK